MGKYIDLDQNSFDETVKEGLVVVDFWAPWCGPCRQLAPVIEQLAEDFEGKATICKVNVDENGDLATKYGIRSIPTIIYFKDGQLVETKVGGSSKEDLTYQINSHLD